MKHLILIDPKADRDLDEQFEYLATDSPDVALRFLEAARVTFEQLTRMPELGSLREFKHPSLAQIRVWQVQGFRNHLVFYRPFQSGIEVVRVLHGARDIPAIFDQED